MKNISVVHAVQGIGERLGGPSRTVTKLCSGVAPYCQSVDLVAGFDSMRDPPLVLPDSTVNVHLARSIRVGPFRIFLGFYSALKKLAKERRGSIIIHDHGVWAQSNFIANYAARRLDIPYVLSPRGMLEPWALNYKAAKKKFAWLIYQERIVKSADVIVATSDQERESVKSIFPNLKVAVIPNGVEFPTRIASYQERFESESAGSKRNFLFLSRIHPKKNLMTLLEAFADLDCLGLMKIVIAGPDELGHRAELENRVKELGLSNAVEIRGPVSEVDKARFYESGHVFVLPSFSENFGVVVAEALSYGLPTIATTGTPWQGLQENDCGWWVPPTKEGLMSALSDAMAMSNDQLFDMGMRGRDYVRNSFSWEGVSNSMIELYAWVTDKSLPTPVFVS